MNCEENCSDLRCVTVVTSLRDYVGKLHMIVKYSLVSYDTKVIKIDQEVREL